MRSPQDLLEFPFTFAQLRPLLPEKLVSEAADRGVVIHRADLDALHRARIVLPLFELRKDTRAIVAHARVNVREAESAAAWHPTSRYDLETALADGRLRDPTQVRYLPPAERRRHVGDRRYESPVYLYSPHQLIMLPLIARSLHQISHRMVDDEIVADLRAPKWWLDQARLEGTRLREFVIALSALDPLFYPLIIGRLQLPSGSDFDAYERWRSRYPLTAPLRWLDVDAAWVKEAGRELLSRAHGLDPLRDWVDLVAEVDPERWTRLRGAARLGVDLRVAAEIFLRYYERLVRGRRAPAIPVPPRRIPSAFDGRLKSQGELDRLLTDYGLSPHARLVLMLEGESELAVMPRVMAHFEVAIRDDFIALQHAGGTGRDLTPLIAFAVAPRVKREEGLRYLQLQRPPTRLLVVFDAEDPVATDEAREQRRQVWVDRIMAAMPADAVVSDAVAARVREQVERLVYIRSWNARGESFEFSHFTDLMLAEAIDALDTRTNKPSVVRLRQAIATLRVQRSNIDNVLHGVSKVDLALSLWPVLERKIKRAERRKTETRIPIVAVLDEAIQLAHELPRRNLVIDLEDR